MDISETNIAFAVKDRIHAALRGFTSKCFPVRGAGSFVGTHAGILMDGRSDFQGTSLCSKTALPPLKFPDVESLSSGPGTFPSKGRYSDRESREGLI